MAPQYPTPAVQAEIIETLGKAAKRQIAPPSAEAVELLNYHLSHVLSEVDWIAMTIAERDDDREPVRLTLEDVGRLLVFVDDLYDASKALARDADRIRSRVVGAWNEGRGDDRAGYPGYVARVRAGLVAEADELTSAVSEVAR